MPRAKYDLVSLTTDHGPPTTDHWQLTTFPMPRFAGDYQGICTACGEHVEFALGIRTDREPTAMHFGPGGPHPVQLRELELTLLVEDDMHVKFEFVCPLCEAWSAGRTRCRGIPEPGEM